MKGKKSGPVLSLHRCNIERHLQNPKKQLEVVTPTLTTFIGDEWRTERGAQLFFFFLCVTLVLDTLFLLLPYMVHQQPCRKCCNGRLKSERLSSELLRFVCPRVLITKILSSNAACSEDGAILNRSSPIHPFLSKKQRPPHHTVLPHW